MAAEPIISIIVPVYNAENYIDACIQSVLDQSVECYELILVDDGSTDKSGILCDTWAIDDERIRVIHSENKGAAHARNLGVKSAKGNYITFVDADDIITTDYVEYLYGLLCGYKADVAIGGYEKIYPDENAEKKYAKSDEKCAMTGYEALEKLLYQDGIMSVPWGMLIKKKIMENVKFPEGTKAEDMGTIYRIMASAARVVIGKHSIYNYFQRVSNTIYSTSDVRNIDYYKHSRRMVSYVRKNCAEYINAAYCRHFSTCFQILSETGIAQNKNLVKSIYKDIRLLQNGVLNDRHARKANRAAALLSLISIRLVHFMVFTGYRIKFMTLKNMAKEANEDIQG